MHDQDQERDTASGKSGDTDIQDSAVARDRLREIELLRFVVGATAPLLMVGVVALLLMWLGNCEFTVLALPESDWHRSIQHDLSYLTGITPITRFLTLLAIMCSLPVLVVAQRTPRPCLSSGLLVGMVVTGVMCYGVFEYILVER